MAEARDLPKAAALLPDTCVKGLLLHHAHVRTFGALEAGGFHCIS